MTTEEQNMTDQPVTAAKVADGDVGGRTGVAGGSGQGETPKLVSGHTLRSEGAPYRRSVIDQQWYRVNPTGTSGAGSALCSCGEGMGPYRSAADRKRWHRQHKAEVLGR